MCRVSAVGDCDVNVNESSFAENEIFSRRDMLLFRLLLALAALSGVAAFTAPPTMIPTSAVSSLLSVRLGEVTMGRGDKRTAKGKRKAKSFGMSRPRGGKLRKLKAERAESEE